MTRKFTPAFLVLATFAGSAAILPAAAKAGNVAWSVSIGGPGFAVSAGAPTFAPRPVWGPAWGAGWGPAWHPAPGPVRVAPFVPAFAPPPRVVLAPPPPIFVRTPAPVWVAAPAPVFFGPPAPVFVAARPRVVHRPVVHVQRRVIVTPAPRFVAPVPVARW